MNKFEEIIQNYLDGYAKGSPEFAAKYANPDKSINKCCEYITSEAKKIKEGNCACVPDDQVFQWARHYYEEDDKDLNMPKTEIKAKITFGNETPSKEEKKVVEAPKPQKQAKQEVKKDFEQLDLFALLGEA